MAYQPERISCLMVTRPSPGRVELLRRSAGCFLSQTYPNRELVVVLDDGPAEGVERVKHYLAGLSAAVTVLQSQPRLTLGALRNRAVEAASGTVVCHWDDDDLSHPTRLAEQYAVLRRERVVAVALQDVLHLFAQTREMYWTNYRHAPPNYSLAGTVMFDRGVRARSPEHGPESDRGEDTALLRGLAAEGKIAHLAGRPYLYVYVYHGSNTYDAGHHRILARSLCISRGLLQRRRSVFDELACLDLGEHAIDVIGNNGPAFQIPGRRKGLADGAGQASG
jgi:glycosyltransferase involved in cell wall biosynthesis